MNDQGRDSESSNQLEAAVAALARGVRRQTLAIWVLIALLGLGYAVPWITYLKYRLSGALETPSGASDGELAVSEPAFDNDFHARPVEEKVKRATAILLTRLDTSGEKHREVVAEIIKQKPGVRLYYKVGDEYERLSHYATPECQDCEGQGQVVFMLGNPASMVYSFSYEGERFMGMGGMPIDELRRLAAASLETVE